MTKCLSGGGRVCVREACVTAIIRCGDARKLIVPAGIPEYIVNGIGMIIQAGPNYATTYFYREEPAILDFTEPLVPELVAVVKVTWPYISAAEWLKLTKAAALAAGYRLDGMVRH